MGNSSEIDEQQDHDYRHKQLSDRDMTEQDLRGELARLRRETAERGLEIERLWAINAKLVRAMQKGIPPGEEDALVRDAMGR